MHETRIRQLESHARRLSFLGDARRCVEWHSAAARSHVHVIAWVEMLSYTVCCVSVSRLGDGKLGGDNERKKNKIKCMMEPETNGSPDQDRKCVMIMTRSSPDHDKIQS